MAQVKTIAEYTLEEVENELNNFIKDKKVIDIKPVDTDNDIYTFLVIYK